MQCFTPFHVAFLFLICFSVPILLIKNNVRAILVLNVSRFSPFAGNLFCFPSNPFNCMRDAPESEPAWETSSWSLAHPTGPRWAAAIEDMVTERLCTGRKPASRREAVTISYTFYFSFLYPPPFANPLLFVYCLPGCPSSHLFLKNNHPS